MAAVERYTPDFTPCDTVVVHPQRITRKVTMNETVRSRWTQADEARLQELIARRDNIMCTNREPVVAAVRSMVGRMDGTEMGKSLEDFINVWADQLIASADSVRDALEPFAGTVRPA